MTRPVETKAEVNAREAFLSHLRETGFLPELIVRDVNDRPDIALRLSGEIIACECVQVPDNRILKWLHKRMAAASESDTRVDAFCLTWPSELHSWSIEAVKKKNNLITEYKKSISANQCWLLIHSDQDHIFQDMDENNFYYTTAKIMEINHGFDRIYFYNRLYGVVLIYEEGLNFKKVKPDLTNGYPIVRTYSFNSKFTTTGSANDEPNVYFHCIELCKEIVIPPIDPDYKMAGLPSLTMRLPTGFRMTAYHDRMDSEFLFD